MTLPTDWFEQLRAAYPKRDGGQGYADGRKQLLKRFDEGHTFETVLQGIQNYAIFCGRKQMVGTSYVMQFATFCGPGLWFCEYAEMDIRSPAQKLQDAEWQDLEERARQLGFTTVDRSRGITVARIAIEQAERANERKVTEPLMRLINRRAG
jgi:hypothetical protein